MSTSILPCHCLCNSAYMSQHTATAECHRRAKDKMQGIYLRVTEEYVTLLLTACAEM